MWWGKQLVSASFLCVEVAAVLLCLDKGVAWLVRETLSVYCMFMKNKGECFYACLAGFLGSFIRVTDSASLNQTGMLCTVC